MDLIVAFITGLTTGGLSCVAFQGGLLASSLAHQLEEDMKVRGGRKSARKKLQPRIAALAVIVFGLVSADSGLNLAGSPLSFARLVSSIAAAQSTPGPSLTEFSPSSVNGYRIQVTNQGYFPRVLHLPANQPVDVDWISQNVSSCARAVVVPDANYEELLPRSGQEVLSIPAQVKGTVFRYSCSMGMYTGEMVFDLQ